MLDKYVGVLRIVALIWAVLLWGVSVFFSKTGFGIQMGGLEWIGFILAIAVTVFELVFNRAGARHNLSLFMLGALAYSYGIWTNFVGIMAARNVPMEPSGRVVFPLALAIILEWSPEVLALWALLGENEEDPLSKIFGGVGSLFSKGGGQHSVPPSPFRTGNIPPFRPGGTPTTPTHLSFLTKPPRGEDKD